MSQSAYVVYEYSNFVVPTQELQLAQWLILV